MRHLTRGGIAIALVLLLQGGSYADEVKTPQTVDGTVTLDTDSVGLVVGYRWGSGTLEYQGKKYPFSISGLSVGDLGVASAEASGDVYNLKKLEDFSGTYTGTAANLTIVGGGGGNELINDKGVVLHLSRTTKGLKLKIGVDGVKLTLKDSK
jgi:hypothetical protein